MATASLVPGARAAYFQFVSGLKRRGVEVDRGVDEALFVGGESFKLVVMRRASHAGAAFCQPAKDRNRDRDAVFRRRAHSNLVEQDERAFVRGLQEPAHVSHVSRKRAEVPLDGRLVADVREDAREFADGAPLGGGDGDTRQAHRGQEAGGLEGYGFAAVVGPGDDHSREAVAERKVNGDDLLGRARGEEQRVFGRQER
jgi:hypothetical protein